MSEICEIKSRNIFFEFRSVLQFAAAKLLDVFTPKERMHSPNQRIMLTYILIVALVFCTSCVSAGKAATPTLAASNNNPVPTRVAYQPKDVAVNVALKRAASMQFIIPTYTLGEKVMFQRGGGMGYVLTPLGIRAVCTIGHVASPGLLPEGSVVELGAYSFVNHDYQNNEPDIEFSVNFNHPIYFRDGQDTEFDGLVCYELTAGSKATLDSEVKTGRLEVFRIGDTNKVKVGDRLKFFSRRMNQVFNVEVTALTDSTIEVEVLGGESCRGDSGSFLVIGDEVVAVLKDGKTQGQVCDTNVIFSRAFKN